MPITVVEYDEIDRPVWQARIASVLLDLYLTGVQYTTTENFQARAKFAMGSSNSSWQVSLTLARAIEGNADAAKILKDLIEGLTKHRKWCNLSSSRPILAEILLGLGDKDYTFHVSPRPDDAIEMHLESIKEDISHRQRYLEIISRYASWEAWKHIRPIIDALSKRSHSSNVTPFGKLVVQGILEDQTFSTRLRDIAEKLNAWY